MPAPTSPFLTAKEAAVYVRMSYDHFRTLQAARQTPGLGGGRRGSKVLYTVDGLNRWLAERWQQKPARGRARRKVQVA